MKETETHAVRLVPSRVAGVFAVVAISLLAGCTGTSIVKGEAVPEATPTLQHANPASLQCVERGGTHAGERRPDGGQYGVCVFPDNRQCEEWALFRSECWAGGIRMTGYTMPTARYRAIIGRRYAVVARSGAIDE